MHNYHRKTAGLAGSFPLGLHSHKLRDLKSLVRELEGFQASVEKKIKETPDASAKKALNKALTHIDDMLSKLTSVETLATKAWTEIFNSGLADD